MSTDKIPLIVYVTTGENGAKIEKQLVVIDDRLYTLHGASLTPGYSKGPVRRVLPGGIGGLEKQKSRKPMSEEMRTWTSPISARGPNLKILANAIIKRWEGVKWEGVPWVAVSDEGIAFLPEQLTDDRIINNITINKASATYYRLHEFVGKYCSHVFRRGDPLVSSEPTNLPSYSNGLYVTPHEGTLFVVKAGKAKLVPLDQVGVAVDFKLTYEAFMRDKATEHMLSRGFSINIHPSMIHGSRFALCTPSEGREKNCVAILRFPNRTT